MSGEPDPRLIYARTPEAHDETTGPRQGISPAARRMLALIDGQRCVGDLRNLARPGELAPIIAELESQRLIEVAGLADEPTEAERRARAAAELALLKEAKQTLRGLFGAELGMAGQVWEARVADCVNMEVLRRTLREAVDIVYYRCGEAAARRVVAAVRPVFEQMQRSR